MVAPGKTNRELDSFAARVARRDVARVLIRCEHLLEQCRQLHFTPRAAGLHVREHALQIANASREDLHLAEALVDLLEPLADLTERFAEA